MANETLNEIYIRGLDAADADKVLAAVLNKDKKIDFSVLVPEPSTYPTTWQDYYLPNTPDWQKWQIENWGTGKWNAYDECQSVECYDFPAQKVKCIKLRFLTATRPPKTMDGCSRQTSADTVQLYVV